MRRIFFVAIFFMLVGCSLGGPPSPFLDPGFQVDGRSSLALSVDWWKWALADPSNNSPLKDMTGAHCTDGQQGNVWFLAGGLGTSYIRRRCIIPTGKYIFFPLINGAYWPDPKTPNYECDQARGAASIYDGDVSKLFAELDGVALADPRRYKVATAQCFDAFEKRIGSPDPGFPAASDGYWVMLSPLKAGIHTIKFGGQYGDMIQDIQYELFVK